MSINIAFLQRFHLPKKNTRPSIKLVPGASQSGYFALTWLPGTINLRCGCACLSLICKNTCLAISLTDSFLNPMHNQKKANGLASVDASVFENTLKIGISARIFHPEPGFTGLRSKNLQYLGASQKTEFKVR